MNDLKPFTISMGTDDGSWRTKSFRQNMVTKIDEAIQRSGMPTSRNSSEMENHVFQKAKSREDYLGMVARLILHVREINSKKLPNAPNMQGGPQNQAGGPGGQQQGPPQPGQGQGGSQGPGGSQSLAPDPINALTNLATQGSRNNQMMNMGGPQGQMQQQGGMGPNGNMAAMQGQMGQQGPIGGQGGPQGTGNPATSLLQTLNHQRPQLNSMQLQGKLGPGMGMVPGQGQMGGQMGGMGGMGGQMGPGMQGQMMPGMSMASGMQVPMSGANTMAGLQPGQMVGGMGGQMPPNMQGQVPGQMGNMGGGQMMGMSMLHMQQQQARGKAEGMQQAMAGALGGGYQQRGPAPAQFLRQSPSPSAPSPAGMGGPSPASMGVMGVPMASPMSVGNMGGGGGGGMGPGGVGSPALAPSPSAHHSVHSQQHMPQRGGMGGGMGMAASPSSSLNTPQGAGGAVGGASPGGEEATYREKVRQLSKYIEPLRRMVHRMVSEGENMEKLQKMKNLLDILSNPSKRMPLETLLKCEVVLEKLDFKRSEGAPHRASSSLQLPGMKEHQIFNPLLEVVNNCLQSPLANHTLKRTFGSTIEALNGPEIRNMPPPLKVPRTAEPPPPEIPDVLQGEIARLDSRFKVSLQTMQLSGGAGAISLVAHLDDSRLPCVPPVHLSVPRDYPASAPTARLKSRDDTADSFLGRVERAMDARRARLPRSCSVGQLLDAWEMSVRQACAPQLSSATYTPVLGI